MKKIVLFVFAMLGFLTSSYACYFQQVPYYKIWKAKFSANLRSIPCVSASYILWTSSRWKNYAIVWKSNGWYKIKLLNWKTAWIWDKSIYELNYNLNSKDKLILQKIYKILDKKNESFRQKFFQKIQSILPKFVNKPRVYTILSEILKYKKISAKQTIKPKINKQVKTPQPTKGTQKLETPQTVVKYDNNIFNFKKVKQTWINWHNEVRNSLKLPNYVENPKLDETAHIRSKTMKLKNKTNHKRHPNDSYYDYWKIADWMKSHGVVCKNIHRATFSESIAYRTFYCHKQDCTYDLINAMRKSFDFYMSEKWKKWAPHYRWIVHPLFRQIWVGIELKKIWKNSWKYFLTTHYCTKLLK